jgi:hypothetical protein
MTRTKPHNVIIATPPRLYEPVKFDDPSPIKPNRHDRRKQKALRGKA